ncbi:MAG: hypothetical protein Q8R37_02830 [Nanoarchaeota archaeon]|nr:hypothetical protein [Nanoarchaeota archaeon]
MGLTEKLTELDEYIWKQFEKVTVKANKELGWNKYDLARATKSLANVTYGGTGFYLSLLGYNNLENNSNSYLAMLMGVGLTIAAPLMQKNDMKVYNQFEERETAIIKETGAALQPTFESYRPKLLFFAGSIAIGSVLNYNDTSMLESLFETTKQNANLVTLIGGIYSFSLSSMVSAHYFLQQILTPPATKKSLFRTVYEKMTGKLKPAPQVEPTKYQSIEDLVAGD